MNDIRQESAAELDESTERITDGHICDRFAGFRILAGQVKTVRRGDSIRALAATITGPERRMRLHPP